jgi:hypothetical protein
MTTEAVDKNNDEQHLPGLQALCGQIGGIITGQAAAGIDATALPDTGSFVVLPSWVWIVPIIDVGRKGRSSTGELYPMPFSSRASRSKSTTRSLGSDMTRQPRVMSSFRPTMGYK